MCSMTFPIVALYVRCLHVCFMVFAVLKGESNRKNTKCVNLKRFILRIILIVLEINLCNHIYDVLFLAILDFNMCSIEKNVENRFLV